MKNPLEYKAKIRLIRKLERKLVELENFDTESISWSDPIGYDERLVGATRNGAPIIGTYKVIHNPTEQIMYWGQGNVGQRRSNQKRIFLNEGKSIITNEGKNVTESGCGTKMYDYDSNLENWEFSWIDGHSKELSQEIEGVYIEEVETEFNSEYMAGKG